jgi:hypothetical protein
VLGAAGRVGMDRDRFGCGLNSFGNGSRVEPRLAEQVRLVLGWTTKLGRGKKKRWEGQNCVDRRASQKET